MKNAVFWDIKTCLYLTGQILRLRYRAQPVIVMEDLGVSRRSLLRLPSCGMLRHVAPLTADVRGNVSPPSSGRQESAS
jgi:hypothetical protein